MHGLPNQDDVAHYGVISLNSVNMDMLEVVLQNGECETWGDKFYRHLEAAKDAMDGYWDAYERGDDIKDGALSATADTLMWCEENLDMMARDDISEIETDEFDARLYGDSNVMMVTWSKYTTNARPCSPCCPNAGDLDSLDPDGGIKTYCLPEEWLEK